MSAVPNVAMKAWTLSLVTISPLASPTAADSARTATIAVGTLPSCPAMVSAATSVPRLTR
jgi:hypothetical protein